MTTVHGICVTAAAAPCPCGATPGQPCACEAGHYHLARIAVATQRGALSCADFASVVWGDVFTGMDTIADPGEPPQELDVPRAAYAMAAEGAL